MKMKNLFINGLAMVILSLFVISCEEEINSIGGNLLGEENFEFKETTISIKAYSRKITAVQSNNLTSYQLGVFKDDTYGTTQVNFLSQIRLSRDEPTFGENAKVDSVVLTIPYNASSEIVDGETVFTFNENYVFHKESPMKISVYESSFFLRDLDPNTSFEEDQRYFSDQDQEIVTIVGNPLAVINDFIPSEEEIFLKEGEEDTIGSTIPPAFRIKLDNDFFQQKIIDKEGDVVLSSASNFKDYFRALYIKAEPINDEGSLFFFNFNNASITLFYSTEEDSEEEEGESNSTPGRLDINFTGNVINLFNNDASFPDVTATDNLYVKGGEGAMTIIELFGDDLDGNGIADELEDFRSKNLLINEANFVFHVNQDLLSQNSIEPPRLFMYNLETSDVLIDFLLDQSITGDEQRTDHLELLKKDENGRGLSYKIRLTDHINEIINRDSTNVRLGLFVSRNFTNLQLQDLRTPSDGIEKIPTATVMSPKGTVLYGTNAAIEEKKLILKLLFTQAKN